MFNELNANEHNAVAGLLALGRPPLMGQRQLRGIPAGIANNPDGGPGAADFSIVPQVAPVFELENDEEVLQEPAAPAQQPMQTRKNNKNKKNKEKQDGGAGERFMNNAYMQQLRNELRVQRAANATRNAAEAARRKKERERGAVATQLEPMVFNVEAGQGPSSMLNGGTRRRIRKSVRGRRRY
jgi:hypothetical protein